MNFLSVGNTLAAVRTSTGVTLFHVVEKASTGSTSINMLKSVDASFHSLRPQPHIPVPFISPSTRIAAHAIGPHSIALYYQTRAGSIERLVVAGEGHHSRARPSDVVISEGTPTAPMPGTSLASTGFSTPSVTLEFLFYQAIDERIYCVHQNLRHPRRGWSVPSQVSQEKFPAPPSLLAFHWTEKYHDTSDCIGVALNARGSCFAVYALKQFRSYLEGIVHRPAFRNLIRQEMSFRGPFAGLRLSPSASATEFRFYGQYTTTSIAQFTVRCDASNSQPPQTYVRTLGGDSHDGRAVRHNDGPRPTMNGPLAIINRAKHYGMKPGTSSVPLLFHNP
ncbi:hypothetical protein OF83DRAFT_261241 [Amylostereum chailletii]|nr:hypothetical protein OF83DRAFT_261241 [Amylostereum chailletii]